MAQYIPKDALVAEIERLENDEFLCDSYDVATGFQSALRMVQEFINTLEVKEVNEEPASKDLEEAASQYPSVIRTISPQWESELENAFKAGAEWQKEQMMKDAVYGLVCGHDESSPAWIDLNLLNKPNVKVGTEVELIIIKDK